ncbi:hypothetical protein XINFAN_00867 [Pseudogemmobacter humi]|uniref:Uncharacterized protein n=1 Tax=Pseudogemmobacter humi TaxID=2483812 RepID=A0A3P5WMX8_9RHOB|nr:hypothetical protein XINFAN_00867 [Pseudogemmobacter humi]
MAPFGSSPAKARSPGVRFSLVVSLPVTAHAIASRRTDFQPVPFTLGGREKHQHVAIDAPRRIPLHQKLARFLHRIRSLVACVATPDAENDDPNITRWSGPFRGSAWRHLHGIEMAPVPDAVDVGAQPAIELPQNPGLYSGTISGASRAPCRTGSSRRERVTSDMRRPARGQGRHRAGPRGLCRRNWLLDGVFAADIFQPGERLSCGGTPAPGSLSFIGAARAR